jgi:hypothetical protein
MTQAPKPKPKQRACALPSADTVPYAARCRMSPNHSPRQFELPALRNATAARVVD